MSKVNIVCALKWGVEYVGITLLGVAHPIREKRFKYGIYADGRLLFGTARVKEVGVWLL